MKKNMVLVLLIILVAVIVTIVLICVNKKDTTNINYEVIDDYSEIQTLSIGNGKSKGYEILEKDSFYYLVIYHGEEPTYFSKLELKEINIDGKNVRIKVELPSNEGMGDAFSYPKIIIKLDQKPNKININNNSYKEI